MTGFVVRVSSTDLVQSRFVFSKVFSLINTQSSLRETVRITFLHRREARTHHIHRHHIQPAPIHRTCSHIWQISGRKTRYLGRTQSNIQSFIVKNRWLDVAGDSRAAYDKYDCNVILKSWVLLAWLCLAPNVAAESSSTCSNFSECRVTRARIYTYVRTLPHSKMEDEANVHPIRAYASRLLIYVHTEYHRIRDFCEHVKRIIEDEFVFYEYCGRGADAGASRTGWNAWR